MRIVVFEWMTGGGLLLDGRPLDDSDSIGRQGAAMTLALTRDLSAAGHQVCLIVDQRRSPWPPGHAVERLPCGDHPLETLEAAASTADWTWLIAPETGGRLHQLAARLAARGAAILMPSPSTIAWASSKQAVAEELARQGIQPNRGIAWRAQRDPWPPPVAPPAVLKPDDGAGSECLQVIENWADCARPTDRTWRVEPWVDGTPVSVAVLAGKRQVCLLEPLQQCFDQAPIGHYVGGRLPIDRSARERALQRVEDVLRAMPPFIGYLGMDLVIARTGGCDEDLLVDVNPRLTCSYVGLRDIYADNLADWIVRAASSDARLPPPTLAQREWAFSIR